MPVITSPAAVSTFRAGDTLTFAGSGTDAEDGALGAGRLTWWADLHHDSHSHPFVQPSPGGSGHATIPVRGEVSDNIFYRFHLRATDSAGATHEVTRDVQPRKAQVTVATQPGGLRLTLDGQPITAPNAFTGVVGIERDLGAASQASNGRRYQFSNWSDGGSRDAHDLDTGGEHHLHRDLHRQRAGQCPADRRPDCTRPAAAAARSARRSRSLPAPATATAASPACSSSTAAGDRRHRHQRAIRRELDAGTAGTRTLTARATDNCGIAVTSAAVTVTINPPTGDTQPPTVSLTAPASVASGLAGTLPAQRPARATTSA